MSHDTPQGAQDNEKVAHILPKNFIERLAASKPSSSIATELPNTIKSKKRQFNAYNPEQKRENMRGIAAITVVGIYGFCVLLVVSFQIAAIMIHASTLAEVQRRVRGNR
jgi:hypothetical protein